MTDNEIIKALECCGNGSCRECPRLLTPVSLRSCQEELMREALDLNNRQQTEIDVKRKLLEKAEAKFESYENCERILICQLAEEREKAIKEFAERLKEKCKQARFSVTVTENLTSTKKVLDNIAVVDESDIDNLVKEMVGDTE